MASYELKNTPILGGHEAREVSSHDRDDFHLQRLGKAPVLKVEFCFSGLQRESLIQIAAKLWRSLYLGVQLYYHRDLGGFTRVSLLSDAIGASI